MLNWRISGATSGGEASCLEPLRSVAVVGSIMSPPRGDGSPLLLLSDFRKLPSRGGFTEWSADETGAVPEEEDTWDLGGLFITVPYNS